MFVARNEAGPASSKLEDVSSGSERFKESTVGQSSKFKNKGLSKKLNAGTDNSNILRRYFTGNDSPASGSYHTDDSKDGQDLQATTSELPANLQDLAIFSNNTTELLRLESHIQCTKSDYSAYSAKKSSGCMDLSLIAEQQFLAIKLVAKSMNSTQDNLDELMKIAKASLNELENVKWYIQLCKVDASNKKQRLLKYFTQLKPLLKCEQEYKSFLQGHIRDRIKTTIRPNNTGDSGHSKKLILWSLEMKKISEEIKSLRASFGEDAKCNFYSDFCYVSLKHRIRNLETILSGLDVVIQGYSAMLPQFNTDTLTPYIQKTFTSPTVENIFRQGMEILHKLYSHAEIIDHMLIEHFNNLDKVYDSMVRKGSTFGSTQYEPISWKELKGWRIDGVDDLLRSTHDFSRTLPSLKLVETSDALLNEVVIKFSWLREKEKAEKYKPLFDTQKEELEDVLINLDDFLTSLKSKGFEFYSELSSFYQPKILGYKQSLTSRGFRRGSAYDMLVAHKEMINFYMEECDRFGRCLQTLKSIIKSYLV